MVNHPVLQLPYFFSETLIKCFRARKLAVALNMLYRKNGAKNNLRILLLVISVLYIQIFVFAYHCL